ncbi:MAG: protein kinase [Pirellulales bacterium]
MNVRPEAPAYQLGWSRLDVSTLRELDRVTREYEAMWREGRGESIEAVLDRTPQLDRQLLLRELLLADFHRYLASGQTPPIDDYVRRFPEHVDLIATCQGEHDSGSSLEGDVWTGSAWGMRGVLSGDRESETTEAIELPDRYRLGPVIARGGMGRVYSGFDVELQREIAIKVMDTAAANSDELTQRFINEATICARLQHPGIVPLHDLGRARDGRPFITMKKVDGRTLQEMLSDRRSPADLRDQFLSYFGQICQAVAYAHSQQVIHRDLKPANIMVGRFGEVQVMDWGLAKHLGDELERVGAEPLETTTAAAERPEGSLDDAVGEPVPREEVEYATEFGRVLGSPAYMSPEQAGGRKDAVGKRSDVFALGGILCKILTGLPPYWGANAVRVGRKALLADVSDARSRLESSGCDQELIDLAVKCLSADPESRPADAYEVASEFQRYELSLAERLERARLGKAHAEAEIADQQRRHTRLTKYLLAAGAVLVCGSIVAVWMVRSLWEAAIDRKVAAYRLVEIEERLKDLAGLAARSADPEDWVSVRIACDEFLTLRGLGLVPQAEAQRISPLISQFDREMSDRKLLDAVRKFESGLAGTNGDSRQLFISRAPESLRIAFLDQQFAPLVESPQRAAGRLTYHPSATQEVLTGGFYTWAAVEMFGDEQVRTWLLDTLLLVESDPWRRDLLQAVRAGDHSKLTEMATTVDVAGQTHQALLLLARSLIDNRRAEIDAIVVDLLTRARQAHRTSFWLTHDLAMALHYGPNHDLARAVPCYASALGMYQNAELNLRLGLALQELGRMDEAKEAFEAALAIEPQYAVAREQLAAMAAP